MEKAEEVKKSNKASPRGRRKAAPVTDVTHVADVTHLADGASAATSAKRNLQTSDFSAQMVNSALLQPTAAASKNATVTSVQQPAAIDMTSSLTVTQQEQLRMSLVPHCDMAGSQRQTSSPHCHVAGSQVALASQTVTAVPQVTANNDVAATSCFSTVIPVTLTTQDQSYLLDSGDVSSLASFTTVDPRSLTLLTAPNALTPNTLLTAPNALTPNTLLVGTCPTSHSVNASCGFAAPTTDATLLTNSAGSASTVVANVPLVFGNVASL